MMQPLRLSVICGEAVDQSVSVEFSFREKGEVLVFIAEEAEEEEQEEQLEEEEELEV